MAIYGLIHPGSGLGNQLHRYVATRVLALDKGYDYSMIGSGNFKGKDFMNLIMGRVFNGFPYHVEENTGKLINDSEVPLWEEKTNYYNPEFNFVGDNTIIDGEFQDERYFNHRMREINTWLYTKPLEVPNDLCVIGFRGGEFYMFSELGLPKDYFEEGINMMKKINPNMRFEVHTDDANLANTFFPDFDIVQDMEVNWRSMRYAKYAIIANSSFYIFPRLLRHFEDGIFEWASKFKSAITIAPRYWARRNIGEWSRPDNFYKQLKYI